MNANSSITQKVAAGYAPSVCLQTLEVLADTISREGGDDTCERALQMVAELADLDAAGLIF